MDEEIYQSIMRLLLHERVALNKHLYLVDEVHMILRKIHAHDTNVLWTLDMGDTSLG